MQNGGKSKKEEKEEALNSKNGNYCILAERERKRGLRKQRSKRKACRIYYLLKITRTESTQEGIKTETRNCSLLPFGS